MDISSAPGFSETGRARNPAGIAGTRDMPASAVSWAAVFAGAAGAAALSLVLLILGTGLGLSAVSPWAQAGATATAIGMASIAWITVTQVLASGMGGYLAGRLRSRWHATPTDEIYFRDTVHGFLAWAVATLLTAALLTSTIGSIIGSGVQAGATVAGSAGTAGATSMTGNTAPRADAGSASGAGIMGYFVDSLFRVDSRAVTAPTNGTSPTDPASPATQSTSASPVSPTGALEPAAAAAATSEAGRILMHSGRASALPADDLRRLSDLVAQRTGLSQAESAKRVTDTYARWQASLREAETAARATADTARKAAATTALWLFISLLIGAFVASLAATFGGRQRDT